jgi:hypothetical protein
MGKILGTSGNTQDIRDGTLCLANSPCPGSAGKDTTLAHQQSSQAARAMIRSIRETQETIRQRIREIQSQLKYLHAKHVPDSQPWISLRPGNIEDLRSKFHSLREALENDLQVLRDDLHHLEVEANKAHRAALRGSALSSTGEFDRDLLRLLHKGEETGKIDQGQFEALRSESDAALQRWQEAVEEDPSPENMEGLLSQLGQTMLVGLDQGSDAASDAWVSLGGCANKLKGAAKERFRANPTSENFRDYIEKTVTSIQLGGEGLAEEMPAGQQRLRLEKSYVVKPGDSLSNISKLFYGTPSLWDFIFFANFTVIGDNPDRLRPGIELQIP